MLTRHDLEQTLKALPLKDLQIRVGGSPGRLVGAVSSPDFESMDNGERQRMVWGHLLDTRSEQDVKDIEFVFTLTAHDLAQLDRNDARATG